MKMTKALENGRRGSNNQKWQGLEQKEKVDVKTMVEAEDRRKEWEDISITGEKE